MLTNKVACICQRVLAKKRMTKPKGATPKSIRTREAIEAAARELFAINGFERTTVRDIAARAQIDPSIILFTRSPHSGERGNAIVMYGCVCVCHEVSQTRCGRTLRRTALVFGSFERSIPLVSGGVKIFAVSRDLDLFI